MQAPAAGHTQRGLLTVAARHRSRCGAPRAIPSSVRVLVCARFGTPRFLDEDSSEHVSRPGHLRIDEVLAVARASLLLAGPVPAFLAAMVHLRRYTTHHRGSGCGRLS